MSASAVKEDSELHRDVWGWAQLASDSVGRYPELTTTGESWNVDLLNQELCLDFVTTAVRLNVPNYCRRCTDLAFVSLRLVNKTLDTSTPSPGGRSCWLIAASDYHVLLLESVPNKGSVRSDLHLNMMKWQKWSCVMLTLVSWAEWVCSMQCIMNICYPRFSTRFCLYWEEFKFLWGGTTEQEPLRCLKYACVSLDQSY